MDNQTLEKLEKRMQEQYPYGVPRKFISNATGGMINPRTCANKDSLGLGIKGRFLFGRKIIYPVQGVIEYIQSRISYRKLANK